MTAAPTMIAAQGFVPGAQPTPPDRAPQHGVAPPRSFADVLRQSRNEARPSVAVEPAAEPPADASAVDGDDAASAEPTAKAPEKARGRARAATAQGRRPAMAAAGAPVAEQSEGAELRESRLARESGPSTATPSPVIRPVESTASSAASDSVSRDLATAARTASGDAARAAGDAEPATSDDARDTAAPAATDDTPAAFVALGASVVAGAPLDASPLQVSVATPVASPAFAAALGVQIVVLARDGVEHAELHLNPADLGPVSISIEIDGSQARIDFGADVAATREAIESGLPELASALSEAGFTLAGGGVAAHAHKRDGSAGEASDRHDARLAARARRAALAHESAGVAAAPRSFAGARIGGVDLYA